MGGTTTTPSCSGDQGNDDAPSRLLERLAGQTLQAEPGAYSVYSNDSFTLAQLVIERVSGMEYTAFLNQYLLEPLGLRTPLTPMEEFDTSRLVKTYLGTDTPGPARREPDHRGHGRHLLHRHDLLPRRRPVWGRSAEPGVFWMRWPATSICWACARGQ